MPADRSFAPFERPVVLVLMGVSGCGKSTVAGFLVGRLGWTFEEGDALHPQSNLDKMAAGHPLNDEDREPWLVKVADWVEAPAVIARHIVERLGLAGQTEGGSTT